MKLALTRVYCAESYTIGHLYVDGIYFCDTLEDKVRVGLKVKNETAIPKGTYEIIVNYSNRFKKNIPLLLSVPNFEGIRIHAGNSQNDTSGCILVGKNDIKGRVTASFDTFIILSKIINDEFNQNHKITIEIK